jgi:hypothetical protein
MKNVAMIALIIVAVPLVAAAHLSHTPDGKPDLTGYWDLPQALRFGGNLAEGHEDQVPYTPAGQEAFQKRDAADDPTASCLPPGVPRMLHSPFPMLIMQSPGLVAELFEYQKNLAGDLHRRPSASSGCHRHVHGGFDWSLGRGYAGRLSVHLLQQSVR